MTLYSKLTQALFSPGRGDEMERVLRAAAASGVTPKEALEVLERMYDEAAERGNESDQSLICDFGEIARGSCQPEFRIWTVAETDANNADSKSSWG